MRVLISGSTGLIGSALSGSLRAAGHDAGGLVRPGRTAGADDVRWDPAMGTIDQDALAGFDAIVNLAGESISGRWTRAKKDRIRDSRVCSTRTLSEVLGKLPPNVRPRVFVSASAIGYYGNRGDELLAEDAGPGETFLSDVCRQWEAATAPAAEAGIRVANARFAVVLSARGGALSEMLTPFRMGLGGRIGSGRQYISWIALADAVGAIGRIIEDDSQTGPVNIASPNPVTNAEFAAALARALHRPALLPTPAFAARLALGQMADELLLASARVVPRKLRDAGFEYLFPNLDEAIRAALSP